jgi:hypothetical protein
MRAGRAALLAAAGLGLAPVQAADADCGASLDARQRRVVQAATYRLAFAPVPAPWGAGRHFALDIVVCPAAGAAMPQALKVDADMPAHRHGMNYRPTVQALGDGRFRADGLLLHMPGRWRFTFELGTDGRVQRLQHELDVP